MVERRGEGGESGEKEGVEEKGREAVEKSSLPFP